jgi:hypothetical protein
MGPIATVILGIAQPAPWLGWKEWLAILFDYFVDLRQQRWGESQAQGPQFSY